MSAAGDLVLGIDGGGTSTRASLGRVIRGRVERLGQGTAGPCNVRAVDSDTALRHLQQAVNAAFSDAGMPSVCVARACIGTAGAGRSAEQHALRERVVQARMAERITVVNDAELVLAAGTAARVGVALIAGTGSLAWARDVQGAEARSGGWGWLLDDVGSGFAIGQQILEAVTRAADDRGPQTALTGGMLRHFGIASPTELIPIVYAAGDARLVIADTAPLAFRAAAAGDSVAEQIVVRAAGELAGLVNSVTRRLGLNAPATLAMAGSVLVGQADYRRRVLTFLDRSAVPAETVLVSDPTGGALRIAADPLDDC